MRAKFVKHFVRFIFNFMPNSHSDNVQSGTSPPLPFSALIIERRSEMGVNQDVIAERLASDIGTISGWENGQHIPSDDRAPDIARAYEMASVEQIKEALGASRALKKARKRKQLDLPNGNASIAMHDELTRLRRENAILRYIIEEFMDVNRAELRDPLKVRQQLAGVLGRLNLKKPGLIALIEEHVISRADEPPDAQQETQTAG